MLLKRAIDVNSVSGLCLTKIDVMDDLETIKICVAYRDEAGREFTLAPNDAEAFANCEPVYESMPGWQSSTSGMTDVSQLPANALAYIKRLEAILEVPIDMISTGSDRKATMILNHPFED